ncbi:glucuronate isomerase [Rubritalea marina]|uniref:glucuronate isomerase n=1 Tax=Rubritalea marina TaxID=361055 RepID=UPI00037CBC1A|nr:glucuronate isomerase [Rubritalea marina]
MSYLHDDVFLDSDIAKRLYHETAKQLPIIDFHTHLPQREILDDHRFENLWELWLKHDHYKWRLMRGCGVDEHFITGDASPWEKFEAFASILPLALGNPVHHWAHLELQRVFGIQEILNAANAKPIWDAANAQLQSSISVRTLLQEFNVELLCTTDDPCDDLALHSDLAKSDAATKVYPTFRPDSCTNFSGIGKLQCWLDALSQSSGIQISHYKHLLDALKQRHDHFHMAGCRLSDHGLAHMPNGEATQDQLEQLFSSALEGAPLTQEDWEPIAFDILKHIAGWNKNRGWTMQLHLGPQRGVNQAMAEQIGPDSGFDTMGSWPQTARLIEALNRFNKTGVLSKTIVYNLNPNESEALCCALQNFQNSDARGLIQYGPAWWHLDHVRGIREQLDILSSLSALGTSVGMLTDSRSFTSYVRHEYFRRLLCQFVGNAANAGEIPNDIESLKSFIADICYHNPSQYFGWPSPS